MKFAEIEYLRPDVPAKAQEIENLAKDVANAASGEELLDAFKKQGAMRDAVNSASVIASIRHTVDTRDAFYDAENDYFDEQGPVLSDKVLEFFRAVLASPHKAALSNAYGDILLEKLEIAVKSSDGRLVAMQQEENALESQYEKLYASAKIPFQGKELTVSQLSPFKQHISREMRKEAFMAEGTFFDGHREELDDIYEKMVQNRTAQAKLMGYNSFAPLGDIRMERHGYTRSDIQACRDAVAKGIVPVVQKLKQKQAQRIGIDALKFYDEPLSFKDGNPTPKGTPEEILAAGQSMYRSLSPQTAKFIDFMMDGGLFDVLSKPGKAPGGYCTYIASHKSPFIFSNFNGTFGDVDVLTHEAGHAFAAYMSAQKSLVPELREPGIESCEIHSMSMEFLTSDYHHLFFGEDTGKYAISHAEDTLFFLPYGCAVDEFQETVYDHPGMSPKERNTYWLELEKKYRPWVNFDGLPFYGRGAGWQRQLHIYTAPFYYIDYVLAQAVALQFFLAHNENKQDTWERYVRLVDKAGTMTYKGLVHAAGMQTPFEGDTMQRVGNDVCQWILNQPGV